MPERSIYEQLTGVKVDDTTLAQLDFTKNSFIDTNSIEYWKGIITVSKILDASRTYPHGLIIPESGTITTAVVSGGENVIIQPSGTEIWRLSGMTMSSSGSAATVAIAFFDGSTFQYIKTGVSTATDPASPTIIGAYGAVSDVEVLSLPLLITNAKYLVIIETGGSVDVALTYSYDKVSL